jgi:hypothetical protein
MTRRDVDRERLRLALRWMSRGDLLIIAQRAAELVPRVKLRALIGDMVRLEAPAATASGATSLLDEVREFHAAGLRGDYYESFAVDSKNFMQKSRGTDAFIAEFDRLLRKCVRAVQQGPRAPVREPFELLFGLLRHIDECHEDVIFFADEAGSWQVGVDWRTALSAYFRCLAEGTPAEEFARKVDRAISDFANPERPRHMAAARRSGNARQKSALRRLTAQVRQP